MNSIGGYVELTPPARTSFRVESSRAPQPPKLVSYGVELGRDKGLDKTGARPILWCQKYLLRVRLQDSPGYLWRSGEIGFDIHRVQGQPLPYFTEPDDRTLYIPIHEGALYMKQYDEMTDAQGVHSFYFAMKFSEEFSFHNEIASELVFRELVFRDFVFLTKDLQEMKISFNEPSLSLKMAPPQIHPTCGFY